MNLIEAIQKRYSCRDYLDKPIEQEKLTQLFELARLAPSAKNLQDWRFVVVTDKETRLKVSGITNRLEVFGKAGAIIVACSNNDYVMTCGQRIGPIDVSIILDHISLLATDLGLATCWIGAFKTNEVKKILGIPQDIEIVELMAIGYPAGTEQHTPREAVEAIVSYDKWDF